MYKIFKNSWALFTGYAVLILAHGLQGNLLGVRAVMEDFNFLATGIMMSGYFVGYFVGANLVPNLVGKVGHIRVFAAFASLASLSILIHAIFVNPFIWTMGRFLTGLSIAGILIIVESWLNDRATNRTRGKVLSIYMVITFSGLAFGSLLLNFDSPKNYEPFILVSLLLSVALVPILLTKRKPPKFKKTSEMKVKELFKISPLASFGMFCTGMIQSSLVTLGAVYATTMNFTILEVSVFIFLITISGAVLQWPIGFLSDLFDRRLIIIVCTFMASAFAIASILAVGTRPEAMYLGINWQSDKIIFYILVALFAGFSLPLFSLNLAYINDFLQQEKFVAAGAGLNIIFGIGGILGPALCSVVMLKLGANGFFMYMSIIHLIIGVFGIFRVTRRKVKENPDNTYTPLPRNITPAGIALDPDTGVNLSNAEKN